MSTEEWRWGSVANIAMKSGSFPVVTIYEPKDQRELCTFFRQLGPLLVDPARLDLMRDWNVILDPKLDRGLGVSGRLSDHSLVDLIEEFGLVNRYWADNPGRQIWMWVLNWLLTATCIKC